jgi:translation elongation factor EF-1beta
MGLPVKLRLCPWQSETTPKNIKDKIEKNLMGRIL